MKKRILSALILLPLLILVYFGGLLLSIAALAVGIMSACELNRGFKKNNIKANLPGAITAIVSLFFIAEFFDGSEQMNLLMLWASFAIIGCLIFGFKNGTKNISTFFGTPLMIFYPGWMMVHVVLIDKSPYSIYIWFVFIIALGTDIFAYFTGSLLGKHKLCPEISPNKTVEGAIGGIVGSLILSIVFCIAVIGGIPWDVPLLAILGSIIAQCGDLSASALKRSLGIKDFGNIIPGHGGILDRFDSVLFEAVFVYYWAIIIVDGIVTFIFS